MRHRDVGVLQHVHLWHPGERVDPRRQRAEIGGRDPVAQADDQLPARTLLDDAEQAPQEGEVGGEDRSEAGVDQPAVAAGLATPREDRVEPVPVSRGLRPVDARLEHHGADESNVSGGVCGNSNSSACRLNTGSRR